MTLNGSYQVSKVIKNFEGGQIITYEVMRLIEQGLLFMVGCDTFAEAKSWVLADMDSHD